MKNKGYTLLELIISMAIFSIFLFVIFGSIGSLYFSQKRLNIIQKFNGETRILMERFVKSARDNVIDYDRYFVEVGPRLVGCPTFSVNQIPSGGSTANTRANREVLEYETIFFWDTNSDGDQDRTLGGVNSGGNDDNCVLSIDETNANVDWDQSGLTPDNESLLLINTDRNKRFAYRRITYVEGVTAFGRIEFQTQLGIDSDNDGDTDTWSSTPTWNSGASECQISSTLITGENTEENCSSAHDWTTVSIKRLDIQTFEVRFTPLADPYMAFRRDDMQIHPRVTIILETELKDADEQGFDPGNEPFITLQTGVSSRIFGNTR